MAAGSEEGEDPTELSSYLASLQTVLASKSDMMASQQDFLMPPPRGERSGFAHIWAAYWVPRKSSACCPGCGVFALLRPDQLTLTHMVTVMPGLALAADSLK